MSIYLGTRNQWRFFRLRRELLLSTKEFTDEESSVEP